MLFFVLSCRKKEKDTITRHDLKGMVYNNCTDSGLAGVNVSLNINDGKNTSSYGTVSGVNGEFSFANIEIHSNSKYSYAINIPGNSGTGGGAVRLDGTTMYFNYNEADTYFKPRVTPGFLLFYVYYITTPTTLNDSVIVSFVQKTFHKNVSDLPYKLGGGGHGNIAVQSDNHSNYPMGKYDLTINKWKSGIYTTSIDSIYLPWGSTKTYTINW